MSISGFSPSLPSPSFGSRARTGVSTLAHRNVKSWQDRRAERALASLSYDTLKDIGFPSTTDPRNTPTP